MKKRNNLYSMILAAMLLAVAVVLPSFTGNVPKIGAMLCPMHLPIYLCGFLCGPWYAMIAGFLAPLLRLAYFGMPPFIPKGLPMCLELATYGLTVGVLYRLLPKKNVFIYVSLVGAMLLGKIPWGIAKVVLAGLGKISFGWQVFFTEGFVNALPGIIVQIILVPTLVMLAKKRGGALK